MRNTLFGLLNLSLEEASTGQKEIECEFVFYAKLQDPSVLRKAIHTEEHYQIEVKIKPDDEAQSSARMRIRKTTAESGQVDYVQTIKVDKVQDGEARQNLEVATPSCEAAFSLLSSYATFGMHKRRYVIPLEMANPKSWNWEVDRFIDSEGKESDWCKIDIEVPVGTQLSDIPDLPAGFTDVIRNQKGSNTPEEKLTIMQLYDTTFRIKPKQSVEPSTS